MLLVRLADPAIEDLREIASWLQANFPEWMGQTQQRLRETFDLLADFPAAGREGKRAGTREFPVTRTPLV